MTAMNHTTAPALAVLTWTRRIAWGALTLFLAAFAIFEAQKYGLPTTAAAIAFFAVPDLFRRHRWAHLASLPLAVLVLYTVTPVVWPPLFTAGLGWLTRIAITRTLRRR
ncbi:DUF4260 domain-containing protein [Streptomyces sp. A7024]|uniref:DUF4260 domain-containing protein n=2 Tax=Streptomyces coryli TaxID=1128680 RepID=A0A6G4TRP7_9ACTN|nr:DUF4260 domain-containing protein [Streptomyces coryli]